MNLLDVLSSRSLNPLSTILYRMFYTINSTMKNCNVELDVSDCRDPFHSTKFTRNALPEELSLTTE